MSGNQYPMTANQKLYLSPELPVKLVITATIKFKDALGLELTSAIDLLTCRCDNFTAANLYFRQFALANPELDLHASVQHYPALLHTAN